ncbi:LysR substrate-binding domain-containing protein [Tahibacter amnicola]|uniref:LysR substrate-binding domain-containing protein n=1 Tax=Tahibacter amnicola TaxID=2976241 RepID=A0ABY6BCZ0_9GAMM|nr:LysR substrate-binding domain-containing protein [Tahibacter amnicola]UXI67724.1 LysR substrate-binding domain-containing protein [Tahibacter amnicola]
MAGALRTLSGLIDFECAARWKSFRLAARELHKTAAGVSQQIKQLETALGFALFTRKARGVVLTEKGRALAQTLTPLLASLQETVSRLQRDDDAQVLRISTTHSFAMKWLVPRLHRFTQQFPQLDIRIESTDRAANLDDGSCDVALRYAPAASLPPADLIHPEMAVVVYSPTLPGLPRRKSRPELADLARHPLLFEGTPQRWQSLLAAQGVRRSHLDFSRSYSHSGLLVQAAVAGHGVALVPYSLAFEDLAQGRLLRAAAAPVPMTYAYFLLCGTGRRGLPKVQQFSQWIRHEIALMTHQFDAGL